MESFNYIDKVLENQKIYFESQKTKNIDFRIRQLDILKMAIEDYEDKIIKAVKLDFNKCEFETYETEIGFVLSEIKYVRNKIKRWSKSKKVKGSLLTPGSKTYIYNQPYGVSLIISPWNYPFQLCISPLIGSIIGGNCCIVKPSELSPNTSKIIKEMIKEYFEEKYICVIEGDIQINQYLLKQKFDYIFFTGSPMVGKIVMKSAADNLIPYTLELGGKSPCIVDESCDIELIAKRIVWGKLLNGGQTCIAPDYIIAHKNIKSRLIDSMIKYIEQFYTSNPLTSKDYTSVINKRHFERIVSLIDYDKVIYGGNLDTQNLKIEPTIMDNVNLEDKIMKEEIFGPLIPVMKFDNTEKLLYIIKQNPNPLALYLFTKNKKFENEILSRVSFGGGCINDTIMHITNPNAPFGGIGNSGIGNYHGKQSFDTFSHKKTVMKNLANIDIKFKYPPYTKKAYKILKIILK
ncbi:aldehyde dehydrogenase [Romboutsia maritimum]|uniref:Aldehyde dehydrogenase n=1 Tax=Romboutsia maritimum TaxID=2020948 RepID=A0A371IVZ3_9FIRM|nr:aldehyde dehydrogenase [Romboutsia maritimum]RDY24650.1 aldehyde dehydrogenase [Romboutsia maritimum]